LLLQEQLIQNKAIFRLDGPKELPYGEDSQVMQYDIGYGNFGGGLHYRPILEVKYTMPTIKIEVSPRLQEEISINLKRGYLESGYDKKGNKIYGHLRYDLSILPNPENTIITNAYIELQNETVYKSSKGTSF